MINAIVIGIVESAPLVLAAVGFTLIYYLNGFINVAYAESVTFGAYMAVLFNSILGWNLYASIVPAALLAGVLSMLTYAAVFRPALARHVGLIEMIILSVGLSFFMRHGLRVAFGLQAYQFDIADPAYLTIMGTGVTSTQITSVALVVLVAAGLYLLIYRTSVGEQIRALASNRELALASGINPTAIAFLVWFLAGISGGLAGIFTGTLAFVDYQVGWLMILTLIMISIIGGVGSVRGALVAGVVLGIINSMVTIEAGSPIYAQVVLLVIFISVLKARSSGLWIARAGVRA